MISNSKKEYNWYGSKKGITLLELLIAIAIIAILAAFSWQLLQKSREASAVDNTCQIIVSAINKTRGYALTGKVGNAENCVPKGFRVRIDNSNHWVKITENDISHELCDYTEPTISIPSNVNCDSGSFGFKVPLGQLIDAPGTINCSLGDSSKTIEVSEYKAICL